MSAGHKYKGLRHRLLFIWDAAFLVGLAVSCALTGRCVRLGAPVGRAGAGFCAGAACALWFAFCGGYTERSFGCAL